MDKLRFQKVLRRVILIPLGVAVILAATLILEVQLFVNRAGLVEHTDQVIALAQRIACESSRRLVCGHTC
jgi:hypothetical protein